MTRWAHVQHTAGIVKPRTKRIPVKVTPEEDKKFKKLAESRHTDVSELIRQLLHREADQQEKAVA